MIIRCHSRSWINIIAGIMRTVMTPSRLPMGLMVSKTTKLPIESKYSSERRALAPLRWQGAFCSLGNIRVYWLMTCRKLTNSFALLRNKRQNKSFWRPQGAFWISRMQLHRRRMMKLFMFRGRLIFFTTAISSASRKPRRRARSSTWASGTMSSRDITKDHSIHSYPSRSESSWPWHASMLMISLLGPHTWSLTTSWKASTFQKSSDSLIRERTRCSRSMRMLIRFRCPKTWASCTICQLTTNSIAWPQRSWQWECSRIGHNSRTNSMQRMPKSSITMTRPRSLLWSRDYEAVFD